MLSPAATQKVMASGPIVMNTLSDRQSVIPQSEHCWHGFFPVARSFRLQKGQTFGSKSAGASGSGSSLR